MLNLKLVWLFVLLCACAGSSATTPVSVADASTAPVARPAAGATPAVRKKPEKPGVCVGADKLAACLAKKGVKLYGSCYDREFSVLMRSFGDSIKLIDVTMCLTCMDVYMTNEECIRLKIDDSPIWIFPDGRRLKGRQYFPTIAAMAGCDHE